MRNLKMIQSYVLSFRDNVFKNIGKNNDIASTLQYIFTSV